MSTRFCEYVARYKMLGLTDSALSHNRIAELEQHLGVDLPAAYRAYLSIAGEFAPPVLVGSDCHSAHLFDLRTAAEILLRESSSAFQLPSHAVVFLMHQGYQFLFLLTDNGQYDPVVFYYFEGWAKPERR